MGTTKMIAIYGRGGHGKVVAQVAQALGFEQYIWVDDNAEDAIAFSTFLTQYSHLPIALGIGGNNAREKVYINLQQAGVVPLTLIHPLAHVAPDAILEAGCVVMPMAVINTQAYLEAGVIINTNAVVEHECRVGRFSHISPSASLAGNVMVEAFVHVGIGSSVIQGVRIGAHSIIGAGAAVINDIAPNVTAVGVPAIVKKESL